MSRIPLNASSQLQKLRARRRIFRHFCKNHASVVVIVTWRFQLHKKNLQWRIRGKTLFLPVFKESMMDYPNYSSTRRSGMYTIRQTEANKTRGQEEIPRSRDPRWRCFEEGTIIYCIHALFQWEENHISIYHFCNCLFSLGLTVLLNEPFLPPVTNNQGPAKLRFGSSWTLVPCKLLISGFFFCCWRLNCSNWFMPSHEWHYCPANLNTF